MNLIINIPDDRYHYIKNAAKDYTSYPVTLILYDAIRNGVPLDELRTEIRKKRDEANVSALSNEAYREYKIEIETCDEILKIIDKHVKGILTK